MSRVCFWAIRMPVWAFVVMAVLASDAKAGGLVVTDLGTVPGYTNSIPEAISSNGLVAIVSNSNGPPFTFGSAIVSGGTVSGLPFTSGTDVIAIGVNASGTVVGRMTPTGSGSPSVAFSYNSATQQYTNLGTLGGTNATANGINNAGAIVGQADTATSTHAFVYANGQMKDLGSLVAGGRSYGEAINASGVIAGSADAAVNQVGFPLHAVLIDTTGTYHDLGTLGTGQLSQGFAINSSNEVVGTSTLTANDFSTEHAFAYINGSMKDLGTLGGTSSAATGVNDAGIVVGYSNEPSGSSDYNHAFVYENGQMIDLNALIDPNSGWKLYAADAINNAGQIVGYGVNGQGQLHAFELTLASVPEPSTLVLLAAGMGVVLVVGRRKRNALV